MVNVVDRQAVAVLSRGTLMDPEMVAGHPDAAYVLAGRFQQTIQLHCFVSPFWRVFSWPVKLAVFQVHASFSIACLVEAACRHLLEHWLHFVCCSDVLLAILTLQWLR